MDTSLDKRKGFSKRTTVLYCFLSPREFAFLFFLGWSAKLPARSFFLMVKSRSMHRSGLRHSMVGFRTPISRILATILEYPDLRLFLGWVANTYW